MWLILVPLVMVMGCGTGATDPGAGQTFAPNGQIGCLLNCKDGLCDSDCDGWYDDVEIAAGFNPCDSFDAACPSAAEAARVCDQIIGCDSLNEPVVVDPEPIQDQDGDGIPDVLDNCLNDPLKFEPGFCGCNVSDFDLDLDGFPDLCLDNCPAIFNPDQLDSNQDGIGDACSVVVVTVELVLFADDGQFLGVVSDNPFDPDSIANQFGTYGSAFNPLSIWNSFGTYGSSFSSLSPWNTFTSTPPLLFEDTGAFIAFLTANSFLSPAIHPNDLAITVGRTDVLR